MGKGSKETVLQRRYTKSPGAHEKISVQCHKLSGKCKSKPWNATLYTSGWLLLKRQIIIVEEAVEKLDSHTACGTIKQCYHLESTLEVLQMGTHSYYMTTQFLLGTYERNENIATQNMNVHKSIIHKNQKMEKNSNIHYDTDEYMNELQDKHKMEYYLAIMKYWYVQHGWMLKT